RQRSCELRHFEERAEKIPARRLELEGLREARERLAEFEAGVAHGGTSARIVRRGPVDVCFVDSSPIADLRGVAWSGFELRQKRVFQRDAKNFLGERDRLSRIAQDLPGLQAADVVEEPSAARVHAQGVALEIEELDDFVGLEPGKAFHRMPGKEVRN